MLMMMMMIDDSNDNNDDDHDLDNDEDVDNDDDDNDDDDDDDRYGRMGGRGRGRLAARRDVQGQMVIANHDANYDNYDYFYDDNMQGQMEIVIICHCNIYDANCHSI